MHFQVFLQKATVLLLLLLYYSRYRPCQGPHTSSSVIHNSMSLKMRARLRPRFACRDPLHERLPPPLKLTILVPKCRLLDFSLFPCESRSEPRVPPLWQLPARLDGSGLEGAGNHAHHRLPLPRRLQDARTPPTPAPPPSICAHRFGESGLFGCPKLTNLYHTPSMST